MVLLIKLFFRKFFVVRLSEHDGFFNLFQQFWGEWKILNIQLFNNTNFLSLFLHVITVMAWFIKILSPCQLNAIMTWYKSMLVVYNY